MSYFEPKRVYSVKENIQLRGFVIVFLIYQTRARGEGIEGRYNLRGIRPTI